jgi:hypothetical protein
MRGLIRTRQRKLLGASVVAMVGLIGGLIVGINAASGTNVPGLGPLDHYLCYTSSAVSSTAGTTVVKPFPQTPVAVWLQNQFSGSILGKVGGMQRNCNPVQKTTPDGSVTPINRPNDHLACFSFTPNKNSPPPVVNITNQFSPTNAAGPVAVPLQVGALQSLCLPTFKSLTAANLQPGAPDDLDHYSCYRVAYPKGATTKFVPPQVQLDDQFSRLLVPAQSLTATVLTPQSLCLPTIKIVNPNPFVAPPTFKDLLDQNDHLLCFGVRVTAPVPFATPANVFDSNQFGIGQVAIKAPNQLCVPSLKQVQPPPPTTTTTIAGVTTTVCDPATGNCGTTTTSSLPCTNGVACTSPPVFTKSFGATTISLGGTTSLTFTLSNPNPGVTLTGITVNDNLPGGLVVASPNGLVPGCGGVFNAPPGSPLVNMSGGFLAPLASCAFKVDVTATAVPPNGLATNVTDPVITDQTGPGPQATATIHIG